MSRFRAHVRQTGDACSSRSDVPQALACAVSVGSYDGTSLTAANSSALSPGSTYNLPFLIYVSDTFPASKFSTFDPATETGTPSNPGAVNCAGAP